jgi:hypothetical protein
MAQYIKIPMEALLNGWGTFVVTFTSYNKPCTKMVWAAGVTHAAEKIKSEFPHVIIDLVETGVEFYDRTGIVLMEHYPVLPTDDTSTMLNLSE